jgi:hypothetical protein
MLHRRAKYLGLVVAAILIPVSVQAQALIATSRYYKVVEHGRSVEIAFYDSLDPDCRSRGPVAVNLLTTPRGGEVMTRPGTSYSNFPATNPRVVCNKRRTASTLVLYRAGNDFTGWDTFDIEAVYPDGNARKYRYLLQVR